VCGGQGRQAAQTLGREFRLQRINCLALQMYAALRELLSMSLQSLHVRVRFRTLEAHLHTKLEPNTKNVHLTSTGSKTRKEGYSNTILTSDLLVQRWFP